ncbi:hypothetical protein GCM10011487_52320 [Steroidobacter agaridevorans]|uniref:DUF3175 domain-containing protein n=1 Tax=Steroidobacter agaridevorans TaxID=2695856 RepID=A0A829YK96_9GAMM|nr:DUF3175 domain-containing protein [Steroidobacter agaridevorans]GFE83232.1 hypothetical protein GCM10011487_52320 [Steroidobacter agaridevorans]
MATARRKRWSQRVTQTSDALTLEEGVFTRASSRGIALSLKRSADRSHKRKSSPYRSAMSMLTFYGNRAGKTLPASSKRKLEGAKEELRKLYGKSPKKKAVKKKAAKKKTARKKTSKSAKPRKARG